MVSRISKKQLKGIKDKVITVNYKNQLNYKKLCNLKWLIINWEKFKKMHKNNSF